MYEQDDIKASESVDIYLINCLNPNCDGFVEYSDNECTKCRVEFTEEDWDVYLQTAPPSELEAIRSSYEQYDPAMICCYKSWVNCTCDKPVDWDDTDKIPINVWNRAYDDSHSNDCNLCAYQYSEECIPLGNFIVNFVRDGVIGDPITICSDYHEDSYVSDETGFTALMSVDYGEF
jgi:hypothetical protein